MLNPNNGSNIIITKQTIEKMGEEIKQIKAKIEANEDPDFEILDKLFQKIEADNKDDDE